MKSKAIKAWIEYNKKRFEEQERGKAERERWLSLEEDYFISVCGNLLVKFPKYREDDLRLYSIVYGFRFAIYLSYEGQVKPYDNGKPIAKAPRDIVPINDWEV